MANKIIFGADLIDVLENKYNMNQLANVPVKYKNGVTTIDFIYGKEKDIDDLKYDKPYVEFSIDDETDGFISGTMYLNGGVEGIQFDSWEDLKYFMKNAKWTESRKSMKENRFDDIIRDVENLLLDDRVLKSIEGYEKEYTELAYMLAERLDPNDYAMSTEDDLAREIENMLVRGKIKIKESKKSMSGKSLKESKVDFQSVIDKVIPKEYAKNKNAYKYALSCVESLYNEDEYDSDSAKVYFLNCYISDSFPSWVDELGEEEMDALANALYDGTMKWSDIDSSWLESKKSVKKSLKESVDGYIATDEDCNMNGKCWVLDGSYNFIMEFLQEWGIAPKDVKVKNGMTTLYNADGNPFGYVYQDEEVDIFVADKTTNWTWENHNPSTKRVKVTALDKIF